MAEDNKQIGRILLKRRLVSQEELDRELSSQKGDGVPLASRLTQSGVLSETDALRALSDQLGVPGLDLRQIALPISHLELVPREVAERSRVLPVLVRDDRLFLAMANPADKRVIDELEFVTGRRIYPYVAVSTTLERAVRDAYDAKDAGAAYYAGPDASEQALRQVGAVREDAASRAEAVDAEAPEVLERRERDSVVPGAAPVVVAEQTEDAAAENELSTSDFGELGEDVSRLDVMSPELRAAALAAAGEAPQETSGKTVLVVDDEEEIRALCRRLLVAKGHRVLEADRGLVALRLVKEERPDLIILDAMLPELHGFEIAKRIKGSEKYGGIPILMMSAIYRGWRIAEDLKANYGIEEYLEKPFRIGDLVSKATRLLERGDLVPASRDPEEINRNAAKYLEDGIAAYKNGEADLAVAMLKKGISLDPLAYRLRYHLALIYGKQGRYYDGIAELERAVELNPKHFPALKNLAVLYEKAGFRNKAVEMWERCVQTAPDTETRTSITEHLVKLL